MLKSKKWFTLLELAVAVAIIPILLFAISSTAVKAYTLFKEHQIRTFILKENTKFNKWLWGIRFGSKVLYIDEAPANHPELSRLKIEAPWNHIIEFAPIDLWDKTEDIEFISGGRNVYLYNTDYITFKKFKVTQLDNTHNRLSFKIDIIMWVDWENNELARSKFGRKPYFMQYSTTLTFRNK